MATTTLYPLHVGKGKTVAQSFKETIDYVLNPEKTNNQTYVSSYECDPRTADLEFSLMKEHYIYRTGRVRGKDDVIAYQLRQSFAPGEITPEEANRLGYELAHRFTHDNHAFIVATHVDKPHIHNHIIFSAVNLDCDRKFRNFYKSTRALRRLNDTLCVENGYSIVENPKDAKKTYDEWMADKKQPTHRDLLREAIDQALETKPATFEDLLKILEQSGWEIKRGKQISARRADEKRFKRFDTLGEDYLPETLEAVLKGEKIHTPKKTRYRKNNPEKFSLVVDIQAKLREGKGAGYERWAKTFNLKQMAKALSYLTEIGVNSFEELDEKTEAAIEKHEQLREKIKAAEDKISEIETLENHIRNYVKTRPTYVAYRKNGYSKKFLEEHEPEILIHKSAKKAFDELNLKNLPPLKTLQEERAKLFAEKKKDYTEYRKAGAEMRQLLTAKANIEKLTGRDQTEPKKSMEEQNR